MEQKLLLFKKTNRKEDKKWDTYFVTDETNTNSITVTLTENAKAQIVTAGINFPLAITINDDDYFIANDKYEDEKGITMYSPRCIIQSFTKIEKADVKKKTLADVWGA